MLTAFKPAMLLLIVSLIVAIYAVYFLLGENRIVGQPLHSNNQARVELQFNLAKPELPGKVILNDLRFYLHNVVLTSADGVRYPLAELAIADAIQPISMVDFRNRSQVRLSFFVDDSLLEKSLSGLSFDVGVPFVLNHANPLLATFPLDQSDMYWVWQQGYKFFKLELSASNQKKQYALHLGSAGCQSRSALRPPKTACMYPNQVSIQLPAKNLDLLKVEFNPWRLLSAMEDSRVNFCSASTNFTPGCAELLPLFGLNPETGLCQNGCQGQTLFKLGVN